MSCHKGSAIVTGASSGIGLSICNMLSDLGFDVYGLARHFKDIDYGFNTIICDITDTDALIKALGQIKAPKVVVNCAGVGFYGLHENISIDDIKSMVRTNLEAPMIITNYFLPVFKRQGEGTIINISSITSDKVNTHGAAYGATKAGLSSFGASVFEEARKHGVKVIEICPDMTATDLYRNASFTYDEDPLCHLEPSDVAQAVKAALTMSTDSCVTRLTVVPQLMRIKRRKEDEDRY
ncbi:MAG: SDR family oxidoreductase [Clostridiales bacterium]|nr:SDR family oxidoreductase [Clostridiales bacterium]